MAQVSSLSRMRAGRTLENRSGLGTLIPLVMADGVLAAHAEKTDVGMTVANRFEIRGAVAEGGMATVYEAWDREAETEVALKIIKAEIFDDPNLRERFRREIDVMEALKHPYLLEILESGQLDDKRLYIVLPLHRQGTVADVLREGPVERTMLMDWARRLLEALSYMHEMGVIHRDLKPSNLLRTGRKIIVADFGIALRAEDMDRRDRRLTNTLQQIGTHMFMSPEQLQADQGTAKSDIYSVALILHMLTVGKEQRPPVVGKKIDGKWGALLRQMGDQDPEERPTAEDALEMLRACVTEDSKVNQGSGAT